MHVLSRDDRKKCSQFNIKKIKVVCTVIISRNLREGESSLIKNICNVNYPVILFNPTLVLKPVCTLQSPVRARVLPVCSVTSVCDSMGCSLPNSPLQGILQARILGWVAIPSSRGSYRSRDQTCVSYISFIAGRFFTH